MSAFRTNSSPRRRDGANRPIAPWPSSPAGSAEAPGQENPAHSLPPDERNQRSKPQRRRGVSASAPPSAPPSSLAASRAASLNEATAQARAAHQEAATQRMRERFGITEPLTYTVEWLPVSCLRLRPLPPAAMADARRLVASMRLVGLKEPLTVVPCHTESASENTAGGDEQTYDVWDGERRGTAARLLCEEGDSRWEYLPCHVYQLPLPASLTHQATGREGEEGKAALDERQKRQEPAEAQRVSSPADQREQRISKTWRAVTTLVGNLARNERWVQELRAVVDLVGETPLSEADLAALGIPRARLRSLLRLAQLPPPILRHIFDGDLANRALVHKIATKLSPAQRTRLADWVTQGVIITSDLVEALWRGQTTSALAAMPAIQTALGLEWRTNQNPGVTAGANRASASEGETEAETGAEARSAAPFAPVTPLALPLSAVQRDQQRDQGESRLENDGESRKYPADQPAPSLSPVAGVAVVPVAPESRTPSESNTPDHPDHLDNLGTPDEHQGDERETILRAFRLVQDATVALDTCRSQPHRLRQVKLLAQALRRELEGVVSLPLPVAPPM